MSMFSVQEGEEDDGRANGQGSEIHYPPLQPSPYPPQPPRHHTGLTITPLNMHSLGQAQQLYPQLPQQGGQQPSPGWPPGSLYHQHTGEPPLSSLGGDADGATLDRLPIVP